METEGLDWNVRLNNWELQIDGKILIKITNSALLYTVLTIAIQFVNWFLARVLIESVSTTQTHDHSVTVQ